MGYLALLANRFWVFGTHDFSVAAAQGDVRLSTIIAGQDVSKYPS